MSEAETEWTRLNVTTEEINRFAEAFKSEEFRQLFADYCKEINDPENRRAYEEELTQLEAERGVHVTFINAKPGFVIKACENGNQKVFINVAQCENVDKPSCHSGQDSETGQKGLNWHIPYMQSRRKQDFDKNKVICPVYDVIFHPDTLHLASKNVAFKKLVVNTACDAVKTAFNLSLDTTNLKFPKLAYKGHPQPLIVRKKTDSNNKTNSNARESKILDEIYPPPASSSVASKKQSTKCFNRISSNSDYAIPTYEIVHRRNTELHELTNELDAKLNITLPAELLVKIDLPLLTTSKSVTIDVNTKSINLLCDTPAKYKLLVNLPYEVNKEGGNAKFDSTKRQLIITLPVLKDLQRGMRDLYREDSGVESDHHSPKEDSSSGSGDEVFEDALDDECAVSDKFSRNKDVSKDTGLKKQGTPMACETPFLEPSINYTLPHFTYNRFENTVAFTLHVKNVEPDSINVDYDTYTYKLKFTSIGSGYFPIHYAFYFAVTTKETSIMGDEMPYWEHWDNNIIVHIRLDWIDKFHSYHAGISENDCKTYTCPHSAEKKAYEYKQDDGIDCDKVPEASNVEVETAISSKELKIEIKNKSFAQNKQVENGNASKSNKSKKSKKNRSLSESNCDDFKNDEDDKQQRSSEVSIDSHICLKNPPKSRTQSESSNDDHHMELFPLKSILKRNSSYDRQASESTDDHGCVGSIDLGIGSFSSIPEEKGEQLSESVRKTVRFDKQLCRKLLFRMNSTIVGQRKPKDNKRKKKKHSRDRRYSEGEASDYENNVQPNNNGKVTNACNSQCLAGKEKSKRNSPTDTKSSLIFDIEI